MRSREELQGAVSSLAIATQSADWQVIKKEIEFIREDVLKSHYMDKGEDAVRTLGVMQGMDVCLNLLDIMKASQNLGNKANIIKP